MHKALCEAPEMGPDPTFGMFRFPHQKIRKNGQLLGCPRLCGGLRAGLGWAEPGLVVGCSGTTLPKEEAPVVGDRDEAPVLVFSPRLVYLCLQK